MLEDNKNLILAIALSVVVLIGWNLFYGVPQMKQQREAQTAAQTQAPKSPVEPGQPSPSQAGGPAASLPGTIPNAPGAGAPVVESREAALARSPRVRIDTPSIAGSINLRGGRIDDVSLKNYRETVDPRSPNIVLLSPSGSPNPYYAEFGWVGAATPARSRRPTRSGPRDAQALTPGKPVTLTWDNGAGLVFRREIAVDDKSMFTVKDTVENRAARP